MNTVRAVHIIILSDSYNNIISSDDELPLTITFRIILFSYSHQNHYREHFGEGP